MKLFLDDIRTVDMVYPPSMVGAFDLVRTYDAFVAYIRQNDLPQFISFDNDLGLDATGQVAPDGYAAPNGWYTNRVSISESFNMPYTLPTLLQQNRLGAC